MVATRSTRSQANGAQINYREKQESDLRPDNGDSDTSEDDNDNSKDAEPIWLQDENIAEDQDVALSSDEEENDDQLNQLIDANFVKKSDLKEREENAEEAVIDDATISLKINKLQEFVKQSQVYSGIIADTLLNKSQDRQVKSDDTEQPAKKRKKITDFFGKSSRAIESTEPQSEKFTHQQPSLLHNCELKPYQLEGVNWLITLYENGLNGILADEMGLGKTLQSIALFAFITEMDTKGPFLIAAPLSTVDTWMSEFARFAPDISVLKYYDSQGQQKRASKIKNFFKQTKGSGVVITSYEMIIRDIDLILSYHWKFLIVDEGHRIKNINCKLIQELKRINTSNRLLLTGTPLQNNLGELWSLLNFILPDIFADFEIFNKWFDFTDLELQSSSEGLNKLINDELEKSLISNLHTILKPFLLRRLKKVVLAKSLPPKREYIVNCPLTPLQIKFYKAALNGKLKQTVFKQAIKKFFSLNQDHIGQVSNKTIRNFMNWKMSEEQEKPADKVILEMDKLYNEHIRRELLNKKLQNTMIQLRQIVDSTLLFFFPFMDPEQLKLDFLLQSSGKLQILQQLVPPLIHDGHKVLIFTQFVTMLDFLEDWCELNQISVCRIDGSMDNDTRQEHINRFNSPKGQYKAFLISTRAGGLGINLTAADSVVLFDSDWNPQVDLQAMDRTHRIGQTKPVVVYRLCCDNTIEHVIMTRAASKRRLEKMVIQMGKFSNLKRLAGSEQSFSGMSAGRTHQHSSPSNKELMQELSQLLLSGESSIGFARGLDGGALTGDELKELFDRSAAAFKPKRAEKEWDHIKLFETTSAEE
ncbi:LANO_0B03114g1_1 [Lachancea nothofagi CBS 11611]|uniref:LANO_0B03114g1_1 n=1 Tax=Lachancea nothofagi CBS 11611 TaxID=1266666 RepID=A0A1G4IWE7_9SACH|nr:LANO_0B03114g1_1 [Lachancea nothofagi CBS 11611]